MMDDVEMQRMLEDIPAPEAMAAEEWSGAWIPSDNDSSEDGVAGVEHKTNDGIMVKSLTVEALNKQRQVEAIVAAAKTEEERKMAVKEANFYRLNLVFSGEEADTVKTALGENPAEKLLFMCNQITSD
jgi:H2-forming N5,N10-methylenetetrahydromethanopterin dehydrogenase-like enzyme